MDKENFLVTVMHDFGLKCHQLGLLQAKVKSRFLRELIGLECLARTVKNLLRQRMYEHVFDGRLSSFYGSSNSFEFSQ